MNVTVRPASPADAAALARLAALDSARVPAGHLLVAEVEGELHAAVAIETGAAIADPFRRTADLVALLRTRARQLAAPAPRRRHALRLRGLRPARA